MALPNGASQDGAAAAAAAAVDYDEEAWGPAPAQARAFAGLGDEWQQAMSGSPLGGRPGWQAPAAAGAAVASTYGRPGVPSAGSYGGGPP